jgi:DNA-binding response OmpR family regulator
VLDLHLPKHEGLAVLSEIRRTPELAHIHLVVLTSNATPREVTEARELGVDWYFEKPTDLDEFLEVARRIFEACDQSPIVDAA